jgi:hypothetical protein
MLLITSVLVIALIVIIVLAAGLRKKQEDSEDEKIWHSGSYSIIYKSPREAVIKIKPDRQTIQSHLETITKEKPDLDMHQLMLDWTDLLESNIQVVEGDKAGYERYQIINKQDKEACNFCENFNEKSLFITRRNIHLHPDIIPPYHLGCQCSLKGDVDWKSLAQPESWDPKEQDQYNLPDWKIVLN